MHLSGTNHLLPTTDTLLNNPKGKFSYALSSLSPHSLSLSLLLTTSSRFVVFMLGIEVECMRALQLSIQSHHLGMELVHLTTTNDVCIYLAANY